MRLIKAILLVVVFLIPSCGLASSGPPAITKTPSQVPLQINPNQPISERVEQLIK